MPSLDDALPLIRAAAADPRRRRACLTYAAIISIAQVGWVMLVIVAFSVWNAVILGCLFALFELTAPILAERKDGGTPWHAHHIAERYGLFTIIALGEGIVGTAAVLDTVMLSALGGVAWALLNMNCP